MVIKWCKRLIFREDELKMNNKLLVGFGVIALSAIAAVGLTKGVHYIIKNSTDEAIEESE